MSKIAEPKKFSEVWCPHGRVSIQNPQDGNISVVSCGAFNTVLYTPQLRSSGGDGEKFMVTTCLGPQCAYYRKKWRKWGRCALAHETTDYGVIAAILAGSFVVAGVLLYVKILGVMI